MQEPYNEGLAPHIGPESCGGCGDAMAEALTGGSAGCLSSSEIIQTRVPTLWSEGEGNMSMGAPEESDCVIVPKIRANKGGAIPAESEEERAWTKRNAWDEAAPRTQSRVGALSRLSRVRQRAEADRQATFNNLFSHLTLELLHDSFYELKRKAAPGIDGITWAAYEPTVPVSIPDLHERLHNGRYRAQPVKRSCLIPFSKLEACLRRRIKDPRMLRLIRKWLKTGWIEEGTRHSSTRGTPQGAVISPLLANVYLHSVLDEWVQWWRTYQARGEVLADAPLIEERRGMAAQCPGWTPELLRGTREYAPGERVLLCRHQALATRYPTT